MGVAQRRPCGESWRPAGGRLERLIYQVFLQGYGSGDCRVSERRPGCFIVEGTPGLRFGWELKGRQRDFDQRRLDAPIGETKGTDSDFGAMALDHIEQIYEGRMQA